jgi:hypothetical protein
MGFTCMQDSTLGAYFECERCKPHAHVRQGHRRGELRPPRREPTARRPPSASCSTSCPADARWSRATTCIRSWKAASRASSSSSGRSTRPTCPTRSRAPGPAGRHRPPLLRRLLQAGGRASRDDRRGLLDPSPFACVGSHP